MRNHDRRSAAMTPAVLGLLLVTAMLRLGAPTGALAASRKISGPIPDGTSIEGFRLAPGGAHVVYALGSDSTDAIVRLVSVATTGGSVVTLVDIPLAAQQADQHSIGGWDISADGTTVVFTSDQDFVTNGGIIDLFRIPIDGSLAAQKLNVAPAATSVFGFAISADSARVVFTAADDTLYSTPLAGGTPVALSALSGSFFFRIASTSARVVFLSDPGSGLQLFSVPIAGGPVLTLTNQTGITPDVVLTADGTKAVFFAGSGQEIWAAPIASMAPVKLVGPVALAGFDDLRLTPDSQTATFVAGAFPDLALFRVPLDASASPHQLSNVGHAVLASELQMSPDGQHYVYRVTVAGKSRLFAVTFAGQDAVELTPAVLTGDGAAQNYRIDPTSQRVVYVGQQTTVGVDQLFSEPIGGGTSTILTKTPPPATGSVDRFLISPDGSRVVYAADLDAAIVREVFSVPIGGGTVAKLHPDFAPDRDVRIGGAQEPVITPDGQVVVYLADQETDDLFEIFVSGDAIVVGPTPTGVVATPTPLATQTPVPEGPEHCDDCLDNDFDGAVDRDDSECPPVAAGGGIGLVAPAGKAALKCEKTLGKIGSGFAKKRVKSLSGCLQKAFACAQSGNDPKCVGKAAKACAKTETARQAAVAKVATTVAKACGAPPLGAGDLAASAGLGFAAEAAGCARFGVASVADAPGVAACLAARHTCRADALVGAEIPRARALLALAGRDATAEAPCLPAADAAGGSTAVKAVVKCQKGVAKAGAAYAFVRLKAEQKCADTVATCVQVKQNKPTCPSKAAATCAKLDRSIAKAATKLHTVLTKVCGTKLAFSDVRDASGVGFGLHAGECTALGSNVDSLAAIADCLVAEHACRVDQLLLGESPRAREHP